ncbi:thiolase C-terminal domain-containing protein [Nonomuraea sp. NPDC050153]|uniref:thiolase C-terminal domain-containing protein n=1 Tax=Nonomuraea sp. NPDC050153 TaxID=3364359 RepID=UPI0037998755
MPGPGERADRPRRLLPGAAGRARPLRGAPCPPKRRRCRHRRRDRTSRPPPGASCGSSAEANTNGGGLSYTHTGMYGMFLLQESVRQLRGQAAAQVPGVEVSVALGNGGMFTAAGTLVLSNRTP